MLVVGIQKVVYVGISFCIFVQDWDRQNPTQIVTEMCGFVTILSGTFLLHKTKDMADGGTNFSLYRHLHLFFVDWHVAKPYYFRL